MRIYFASALFNSRETMFNLELASRLSSADFGAGHRVLLPQRDGFEFSELGARLGSEMPQADAETAVQKIIYTLDMGGFLAKSNAVVAILDEPLDEGVLIEVSYARRLQLPVVGVRTDSRSPFGSSGDALGGIHFFAAFQCTSYIRAQPLADPSRIDDLARTVIASIESEPVREATFEMFDPLISGAAAALFDGIDVLEDDLHEPATIGRIVANYLRRRDVVDRLAPRLGN